MVACRSCGRNIASGTIRCSKCSTPFHLSCSHRYKISPEGVFNVCCGPNVNSFPGNGNFQMRTRNRNKRRQPQQIQQQKPQQIQQQQNNSQQSQEDSMRYGKIQKTEVTMGINEKPNDIDNESNNCPEIIQEDFQDNENNLNNFNSELRNSVEILNESVDNEEPNHSQSQTISVNSNLANIDANNKITLETVWQGISSLQNSISNISNSLDTVSTQLNTIDPRIIELESSLNTIKAKTTNFDNMQNDVSGLRGELEHISSELENLKSSQQEKNVDVGEIFSEIREREIKSRNILIYNVPEDNLRISQDYSTLEDINKFNDLVMARDNSRAREILEPVPNIDLDEIETRRLGRVNPDFCRPLRVTLQSRDDVITVMKNRSLINKTYNVKTDLTKRQQAKIKTLKEELEQMKADQPQTAMTIKFINGEPKLIPIVRRNLKNE